MAMDDLMPEPVKPITPKEAASKQVKNRVWPSGVIEAFNELIAQKFDGRTAVIMFDEAFRAVAERMRCSVTTVESNAWWMNVEELYRQSGWRVDVDSPAFNETYKGSYKFTKTTRGKYGDGE